MWRVWALLLVSPVLGAEEFLQGDDVEGLERHLDDLPVLGEVRVRWRVRGAAREWERLHWYQRVEWEPRLGQEFFAVAERDPGERRMCDFNAFYYKAQVGKGTVVIGDFRPGFGTGMVFGRRSRGGVPSRVPSEDSRRLGYRSSGENESLRGVVGRYGRGSWEGVLLGGRARRDGRLDQYERVSALPASGYHVTETEIAGRDLLGIGVGGARLHWRGERWQWGGTVVGLEFSHPLDLRRDGRTPWGFVGRGQRLGAVDLRFNADRGYGVLEMAGDDRGHWGIVGAARIRAGGMRVRALGRYYAPGFHSFFGGAPGASGMKNELGGLAVLSGGGWHLFVDAYRRPKRSYFVPVAATYITWGGAVKRQLGKGGSVRGQWQGRGRPRWQDGLLRQERSSRVRFDLDWAPWRWRGEVQRFGAAGRVEWGFMASMRLKGRWATVHLSRFRTASYATRIYEYEVDLPGTVSIRPLYGAGWRGYVLFTLRCKGLALNVCYRVQRDRSFRYYGGVQVDWVRGSN